MAVFAVIVLGTALVVFARTSRDANAVSPSLRDHWHIAYSVYDCDTELPIFQSQFDPQGIHSHQDGLIHVHPFSNAITGENAVLGIFLDTMGAEVTPDHISGPEIGDLEAGSDCNGEPTVIKAAVWPPDSPDAVPEVYTDNFNDIVFTADRQVISIARVPADADVPYPSADRLDALDAATGTARESTSPEDDPSLDPNNALDEADLQIPDDTGADLQLPEDTTPATDSTSDE